MAHKGGGWGLSPSPWSIHRSYDQRPRGRGRHTCWAHFFRARFYCLAENQELAPKRGGQRMALGHMAPHATENQGRAPREKGLGPIFVKKVGFVIYFGFLLINMPIFS
jgi:hypothetical protein